MAVEIRIRDISNKMKNLDKALNFFGGGEQLGFAVGLIEGKASDESIFKGTINELGYTPGRIPKRPWFSKNFEIHGAKYERFLVQKMKDNWNKTVETGRGIDSDGNELRMELAEMIVSDLKESITEGDWKENAPSTVEKKGFDWPLVETGVMHDEVDYVMFSRRKK